MNLFDEDYARPQAENPTRKSYKSHIINKIISIATEDFEEDSASRQSLERKTIKKATCNKNYVNIC